MRPELLNLPEPNWFHHGVQILDLLDRYRPMTCVELGSNRGCSAIAVARMIRQWGGLLTCVDLWTPGPSEVGIEVFAHNIVAAGVSPTIRMVHAKTADAAEQWRGDIDYLYVDADHSYEGCMADLEMWWPHLRIGGLIAGDDYGDPHGDGRMSQAWDDFEQRLGVKFRRTLSPELLGCQCEPCKKSPLIWGVKQCELS